MDSAIALRLMSKGNELSRGKRGAAVLTPVLMAGSFVTSIILARLR